MKKYISIPLYMRGLWALGFAFLLVLSGKFTATPWAFGEEKVLRVALYEGKPNLFTDSSGEPSGFFADLLERIASLEGWHLEYVSGTWAEGLERLKKGEVHLMTSLARTEEREKIYSYSAVPAIVGWSTAYVSKGSPILSILDLKGKRVAVLEGSVQQSGFLDFIRGFGVNLTLLPVPDEKTGFAMVTRKEADAVISVSTTGELYRSQYGLKGTAIMFHPKEAYFAAPKGDPQGVIPSLDFHLARMKENPDSAYYTIQKRWFPEEPVTLILPLWLRIAGALALTALLCSLITVIVLRWQIKKRTAELVRAKETAEKRNFQLQQEIVERERIEEILKKHEVHLEVLVSERTEDLEKTNQELQREIAERKQVEEELFRKQEQIRRISDNLVEGFIYQVACCPLGKSREFRYVSAGVTSILGISPERMYADSSVVYQGILHPEDAEPFRVAEERSFQNMSLFNMEGRFFLPGGSFRWLRISSTPHREEDGSVVWDGIAMDITERKLAEERIRRITFHDSLTGLYNRRYLEEEMERLDRREQFPLSLIMADSNGLKLVNDTYGHAVGDEMLRRIAQVLEEASVGYGPIGRWGGDEFLLLLPRTEISQAGKICKNIMELCRFSRVRDIPLSISLGMAEKTSEEQNLSDILSRAEDDMYKRKLGESRSARRGVVSALLKALGAKSCETEEHTRRMEILALKIGEKVGLPESELKRLSLVVILHDIGKIHVDEAILAKKGPLTPEEWEIIKKHPEAGSRIARATEEFAHVAEDVLSHHERWDGTGYPRGLKENQIPLLARITAIVDAYDVMTNGRPYRKALSRSQALKECERCSGTQFDPQLVKVFADVLAAEFGQDSGGMAEDGNVF